MTVIQPTITSYSLFLLLFQISSLLSFFEFNNVLFLILIYSILFYSIQFNSIQFNSIQFISFLFTSFPSSSILFFLFFISIFFSSGFSDSHISLYFSCRSTSSTFINLSFENLYPLYFLDFYVVIIHHSSIASSSISSFDNIFSKKITHHIISKYIIDWSIISYRV